MVFQANKWGWKALAAKLLLAPLVAGSLAAPAQAQTNPTTRPATNASVPMRGTEGGSATTDPKDLLKLGRRALAEGDFDAARDYARQAEANNPSGRWGLTGDTPESLVRDVQTARAKANRAEAEKLARQAKDWSSRPARTDAEKLANLDQASAMIDRACSLAGPSGWASDLNPFAEKPETLKREIDAARAKLRKTVPVDAQARVPAPAAPGTKMGTGSLPSTAPASSGTARISSGVQQTKYEKPLELEPARLNLSGAAADKTATAQKMLAQGRVLLAEGKYSEARAKFMEAEQLGVPFSVSDDNPSRGITDAMAKGKEKINSLVIAAQRHANSQEWNKAVACMTEARNLAASLDLRTATLDEDLAAIRKVAAKASETVQASATSSPDVPVPMVPSLPALPTADPEIPKVPSLPGLPATPGLPLTPPISVPDSPPTLPSIEEPKKLPEMPKSFDPDLTLPELGGTGGISKPSDPLLKEPAASDKPKSPAKSEPLPKAKVDLKTETMNVGLQLLKDAGKALRAGELENARELATKAHNGGHGDSVKQEAQKLIREIDAEESLVKKKETADALKSAVEAYNFKQYETATSLLSRIHSDLLSPEQQKVHEKLTKDCADAIAKLKAPAVPETPRLVGLPTDGGTKPLIPSTPTAPAAPSVKLSDQVGAMAELEFQQLRDEGLRTETQARQAFDRGDTDVAIQMLADFASKVKGSKLSTAKQSLILNPVERRLDGFRIMKRQVEFYTKEARAKKDHVEGRLAKATAEQQKQDEIASRVRQVQDLLKARDYKKAEELALQTKQLDPENPTLSLVYDLAKQNRRKDDAARIKDEKEIIVREGLNASEKQGPFVDTQDPVAVHIQRSRNALLRGSGDDLHIRTRTPVEREIELKLEKPLTLEFQNAPLRDVIGKFREAASLNIVVDDAALAAEGLEIDKLTVTEKITSPISLRSVMNIMFQKHGLQQIVEDDVVKVTTSKRAKGRLYTKVYSVMDLVTPIPDFALPEHAVISKVIERQMNPQAPWTNSSMAGGPQLTTPNNGLNQGQMVGGGTGAWSGGNFNPAGAAGQLQSTPIPGQAQQHPLGASAHLAPVKSNASEQLKRLITGMVRPYSWQEVGGPGKIDYYDIGGALVVNQTADVIKEITDLLESLRRLQDLSIAVEIRVVSLTEDFYERVGVDFAMNVKTNKNIDFERQLTTGQFRPDPFINSIDTQGAVVGWIPPAGGFTSDLKLPIRPNSYGFSVPPFGNYPGNLNGGLNLGLAFLNDIQVYMFMEAAAGNRRINVMQAPKITLFNGQTSTVSVQDFQYFTTGLSVTNVGGQFVYVPQNVPMPVGQGDPGSGQPGVAIAVQGVVSSDRRFVRMTLTPSFTVLNSATVPLFPVTAFITPVFEGGSQGVPIPFTQFFQQPAFQVISVQTTVAVPDGGTVLMGGLKTMSEGRNEFGPPVLSNIPYLNRLFKNTAIGRDTRHIMLMVTPRIIINLEEELTQTGVQ